jgi:NAD(P)-dependent dehydrogenase (short-subunit alcohol dehydrogenase family)
MSGWSEIDLPDLSGKIFVVTGANSGIGLEAALSLAKKHGSIVLACRSLEKGRAAVERIREEVPGARLELEQLDLGDLASVRAFAEKFSRQHPRLHVLVNNAGVMAVPRRTTKDGFEMQIGTNHLGHFALTGLLLGRLVESAPSRVVTVSSLAHALGRFGALNATDLLLEQRYSKWGAYARSKLANLLFAFELERRLQRAFPKVTSVACHPGYAATNLQAVGPEMTGSAVGKAVMALSNSLFAQSAAAGALPTLYAAVASDVHGGDFIGPSGPFHLAGPPKRHPSKKRACDVDAARRLWDTSVELTHVDYALLDARTAPAGA